MTLAGVPTRPEGPREARARGVAMIYQELTLAPHLTVEANVMLGQERVAAGLIRRGEHRRLVAEALGPARPSRHPARGRSRDAERRGAATRRGGAGPGLERPGDRLRRADQLADRARRRAAVRGHRPAAGAGAGDRLHQPFPRGSPPGRPAVHGPPRRPDGRHGADGGDATVDDHRADGRPRPDRAVPAGRRTTPGEPVLELTGLAGRTLPRRADLTVRRGEILGIAGLVGAGRTELLRAIFGLDAGPVGRGPGRGHRRAAARRPRRRIAQGLGFLSEDRKGEGLALGRSIEDNLTYSALGRLRPMGLAEPEAAPGRGRRDGWRGSGSRRPGPAQAVGDLSGGNQQKVALARLLHQEADVLLLDEPTRGIDVGSKAEIYRLIGELAAQGKAVVMVSSYLPELFGICDRIAVMTRGVLSEARPVAEWTEHAVMEVATGG